MAKKTTTDTKKGLDAAADLEAARAVLARHGRPGGLVRELTAGELKEFAKVQPGNPQQFDAAWQKYRQRIEAAQNAAAKQEPKPES